MTNWYYSKNGKEFGPISSAELKALVATGALLPNDLVRTETTIKWNVASKVVGLFESIMEEETPPQLPFPDDEPPPLPTQHVQKSNEKRILAPDRHNKKESTGDVRPVPSTITDDEPPPLPNQPFRKPSEPKSDPRAKKVKSNGQTSGEKPVRPATDLSEEPASIENLMKRFTKEAEAFAKSFSTQADQAAAEIDSYYKKVADEGHPMPPTDARTLMLGSLVSLIVLILLVTAAIFYFQKGPDHPTGTSTKDTSAIGIAR